MLSSMYIGLFYLAFRQALAALPDDDQQRLRARVIYRQPRIVRVFQFDFFFFASLPLPLCTPTVKVSPVPLATQSRKQTLLRLWPWDITVSSTMHTHPANSNHRPPTKNRLRIQSWSTLQLGNLVKTCTSLHRLVSSSVHERLILSDVCSAAKRSRALLLATLPGQNTARRGAATPGIWTDAGLRPMHRGPDSRCKWACLVSNSDILNFAVVFSHSRIRKIQRKYSETRGAFEDFSDCLEKLWA